MRRVLAVWIGLVWLGALPAAAEGDAPLLAAEGVPLALPAAVAEALRADAEEAARDVWEISLTGPDASLGEALPAALGDSTSVVDPGVIVPESVAPPASAIEALQ